MSGGPAAVRTGPAFFLPFFAAITAAFPSLAGDQSSRVTAPIEAQHVLVCKNAADGRAARDGVYVCVRAHVRVCAAAAAVDVGVGSSRGREWRAAPRALARPVTGHGGRTTLVPTDPPPVPASQPL